MTANIYTLTRYCIACAWIANGLFCKILNLVPRHEQIVARILGPSYSRELTLAIGCAEMLMAAWILSGIKPRFNALCQIIVVATMNSIEFLLAPDLLLWGRLNAFFALLFVIVVYLHAFKLNPNRSRET